MILTIYVHGMDEPLAREVCDTVEMREALSSFGSHRIEKVILTDFRPVKKKVQGKEIEICPDF